MLQLSRSFSSEEDFYRQDSDEYFVNAIGFLPYTWNAFYYQPRAPVLGIRFEFSDLNLIKNLFVGLLIFYRLFQLVRRSNYQQAAVHRQ
jgi:hypothetical protein